MRTVSEKTKNIIAGISLLASITILIAIYKKEKKSKYLRKNPGIAAFVDVGLVILKTPKCFRDFLKNDVILEETVKNIRKMLYVYICYDDDDDDNQISGSRVCKYASQLYADLWNEACFRKNLTIDFRIVNGRPLKELINMNEISTIYVEDKKLFSSDKKLLPSENKRIITFCSQIQERCNSDLIYFEDLGADFQIFDEVILGGTFDHLHNGHKKLLFLAGSICTKKLIVGVSSTEMLKQKFRSKSNSEYVQDFNTRMKAITEYMSAIQPSLAIKIIKLRDPFGPAISMNTIQAIVVSTETISGALKINEMRKHKGLNLLKIYVSKRTLSSTLSSSYIRSYHRG